MSSQRGPSGRPPISINTPPQQEAPQQGGLSYQEQPSQQVPQRQYVPSQPYYAPAPVAAKSGGSMMGSLLIGFVVLLVSVYAGTMLSASKADVKVATDSVTALQGQVTNDKTRIDNLITSVGATYATKADLNTVSAQAKPDLGPYATKDSLGSYLKADMSNFDASKLTSDQLSALKSRLNITSSSSTTGTTGTTGTATTTPGGPVTVSIYSGPQQGTVYTPGTYTWFLTLTNTDTAYHRVYLLATLGPSTSYTASNTGVVQPWVSDTSGTNMSWQASNSTPTDFVVTVTPNPSLPPLNQITQLVRFTSNGYILLGPGQSIPTPVSLVLAYNSGVSFWTMDFATSALSYP